MDAETWRWKHWSFKEDRETQTWILHTWNKRDMDPEAWIF